MSIICEDLLKLKHFEKLELIAGAKGLKRTVTWPYVGQTISVANWVHGGELLFITGVTHRVEDLSNILHECISKRLAGLVILVGPEYISEIPPKVIEEASLANFPLFKMPWDVKLIDLTREITDLIMFDQFEKKKAKSFLGRLLFSSEPDYEMLSEQAAMNEIVLQPYIFIAVFNVYTTVSNNEDMQQDILEDKIQHSLSNLSKESKLNLVSLVYGNNIICLVSAETEAKTLAAVESLKTIHTLILQIYPDIDLLLGLGRSYNSISKTKNSYEEAKRALKLGKKINYPSKIITYSDLGIYRLFFKINDIEEIRQFYLYNLGILITYDRENKAELLNTLHQYLLCNSNLVKTSQALFIHRNTLLYRLNQIRDLLHKDLDDAMVKLDLFNSIIAKNYLNE